jgi:hypothetical protein
MKSVCQILTTIGCSCLVLYGSPPIGTIHSFVLGEIGREPKQVQLGIYRATVVVFVSALCPMSMDYGDRLKKLNEDFSSQDVRMILVNSNQNEPDTQVEEQISSLRIPVYRDPHGQLAELLAAYSTPTAVVLDQSGTVRYSGAIDDARNSARVTKQYLRMAIEAILEGKDVAPARTRAFGCSIKRSPAP